MHRNILIEAKYLKSLGEKSRGLINRAVEPVFFKTRFGIHTFGMSYPIDVLVLDKEFKVVNIKENLKPNNLFFWFPVYDNILELPKNTVREHNIKIGIKVGLDLY